MTSANKTIFDFRLERNPFDQLVMVQKDGVRHIGVEPVRAFPLSDRQHAVSICDHEGREVLFIDDIASVSGDARAMLEEDLSRREFVPVIRRILNMPADTEPTEWQVETDRGFTSFQLNSEDDVHRTDKDQVTVVDSHGIRYLIPNARKLDTFSRKVLDIFL